MTSEGHGKPPGAADATSGDRPGRRHFDHQGLFSYNGPFDLHPGPILVLGPSAKVLAANAAARPIADSLRQGANPAISEALTAAFSGRVAQVNPYLVKQGPGPGAERPGSEPGVTSAFDLMLLPWAESEAVLIVGREVTVDRSLRSALVDSRQRFKDLVEISSDLAWETDRAGKFSFVSAGEALGHRSEDMVGCKATEFLIDDFGGDSPFSSPDPVRNAQVWFRRADGTAACLSVTAVPLRNAEGAWSGARGLCRDISEAQARDAELSAARAREQLLAYVLRNVRDETDPRDAMASILSILQRGFALDGLVLYQGEQLGPDRADHAAEVARLGCLPPDDLVSGQMAAFLSTGSPAGSGADPAARDAGLSREGQILHFVATHHRNETNGLLVLHRADPSRAWTNSDISLFGEIALHLGATISRLGRQEALQRLSDTDPLTGLMNRRGFMRALDIAQKRCVTEQRHSALFFIDLDNFKDVNDRLGHKGGDELLQELARRLVGLVRERDLVARLGGDEFAVLLQGLSSQQAARRAGDMETLGRELRDALPDTEIAFGLSIGLEMMDPDDPSDGDTLLARADEAMYRAKADRKSSRSANAGRGARRQTLARGAA